MQERTVEGFPLSPPQRHLWSQRAGSGQLNARDIAPELPGEVEGDCAGDVEM